MAVMAQKRTAWTPKKIRELRAALTDHFKWSQAEMAKRCGVTDRHWRNWEAGDRVPTGSASVLLDQLTAKLPADKRPK